MRWLKKGMENTTIQITTNTNNSMIRMLSIFSFMSLNSGINALNTKIGLALPNNKLYQYNSG